MKLLSKDNLPEELANIILDIEKTFQAESGAVDLNYFNFNNNHMFIVIFKNTKYKDLLLNLEFNSSKKTTRLYINSNNSFINREDALTKYKELVYFIDIIDNDDK